MKPIVKLFLVLTVLSTPFLARAQKELGTLKCPFEHGSGREPKEPFTWEPRDEKIIMISQVDTTVRSCITGTVSNVEMTEDNQYQVVIYVKNYYFWYYGVAKPLVKKGDKLKAGQPIGTYKLGSEMELRMFKDEQQLDPREMLECKVPRADDK